MSGVLDEADFFDGSAGHTTLFNIIEDIGRVQHLLLLSYNITDISADYDFSAASELIIIISH